MKNKKNRKKTNPTAMPAAEMYLRSISELGSYRSPIRISPDY